MANKGPEGWIYTPINSILTDCFAGTWGKTPTDPANANAFALRSTNIINNNKLDYTTAAARLISDKHLKTKTLQHKDVILEISGGSTDQPVARPALFDAPDDRIYICSNFFRTLRADTKKVDQRFLFWSLYNIWDTPETYGYQQQTTGIRNLNVSAYLEHPVLLPPLPEQKKIAAILSSVDEAIEATEAVIEQTRTIKKGLLQELLTRGIGHTEFKKTAIGEIPRSWKLKSVDDLCSLSNGHGFRPDDWSDEGYPIIRIGNLNGSEKFNYFNGEPEPKWLVEPGQLLFAWAGVAGVSFGPTIWRGKTGVLNQHIYKVHPAKDVDKTWLFEALQLVTSEIERWAHGFKSSLLHVRKSDITNQLIPFPTLEEQQSIATRSIALQRVLEDEELQLSQLKKLKRGLLQDLLTGKVRVNTLDLPALLNAEAPAEALAE
ncbi:hypothetical protein DL240_14565 [Lujinxingia litoralis]|uniref:Type I restriction modification DNA specificity domain-containing protein n=1 Tax=Lujinxingia litoralis TaxID=2211119 RepID=A0A328C8E9_9DELT|nr:restriction endonuclease subunit S [Lujinxingia litoralis]RAL20903.1 hypothetical protein DL240_14565 [Lujinxingia litoralis]